MTITARFRHATAAAAALLGLVTFLALFTGMAPASAATAGPAETSGVVAVVGSHGAATRVDSATGTATITPNIQEQSCTAGRATWVHLYGAYGSVCFGFTGTDYLTAATSTELCAGNNHGTVYWNYNGGQWYENFGAGTIITWVGVDVTAITINGWSGSDTC